MPAFPGPAVVVGDAPGFTVVCAAPAEEPGEAFGVLAAAGAAGFVPPAAGPGFAPLTGPMADGVGCEPGLAVPAACDGTGFVALPGVTPAGAACDGAGFVTPAGAACDGAGFVVPAGAACDGPDLPVPAGVAPGGAGCAPGFAVPGGVAVGVSAAAESPGGVGGGWPSAGARLDAGGPGFGRLRLGDGRRASARLRLGALMTSLRAGRR
ncbi:hypothetical protein [Actinoplanes utahensis]|uniref:hypothetical protein n=1 Tax=Actinoplanes utahensis TaxID=1869 RepID=UPI001269E4DF|nr:hypothetical protein [Actinoplanes utahensis]GIF32011.1 hypothetical protein Aut01nite_49970 [Actinoplanes utahensis]